VLELANGVVGLSLLLLEDGPPMPVVAVEHTRSHRQRGRGLDGEIKE